MVTQKPRLTVVLSKKCRNVVVRSGVLTRRGWQIISIRGDEAAAVTVKYVMAEKERREDKFLKGAVKAGGCPAKI
jgi:hypothetical protein